MPTQDINVEEPPPLWHDHAFAFSTYKKEGPLHRLIILLKAQGQPNKEIAALLNCTPVTVSLVLRQPWARELLLKLMHDHGEDAIASLLKSTAADSIHTLIELRDDLDVPAAIRRQSASDMLDRFLPKPTQKVEVASISLSLDVKQIDAELAALEAEERRLCPKTT